VDQDLVPWFFPVASAITHKSTKNIKESFREDNIEKKSGNFTTGEEWYLYL